MKLVKSPKKRPRQIWNSKTEFWISRVMHVRMVDKWKKQKIRKAENLMVQDQENKRTDEKVSIGNKKTEKKWDGVKISLASGKHNLSLFTLKLQWSIVYVRHCFINSLITIGQTFFNFNLNSMFSNFNEKVSISLNVRR